MIEINLQSLLILLICIGVVVVIILLYQLFAHDKDERKNKLRAFKASHRPEAWHSRKRGKRNKDLEELQAEVRAKGLIRRAGDL